MKYNALENFQSELHLLLNKKKKNESSSKKAKKNEQKDTSLSIYQHPDFGKEITKQNSFKENRQPDFQSRLRELQMKQQVQNRINEKLFNGLKNTYDSKSMIHTPQKKQSIIQKFDNLEPSIHKISRQNEDESFLPPINRRSSKKIKQKKQLKQQKNFDIYINQINEQKQDKEEKIQKIQKIDKKEKEIEKKKQRMKKFRVIGIAVYFSVLFPKYSKSFTLRRFKLFREIFVKNKGLAEKQKKIIKILKDKFQSFISENLMKKNDIGQSKEIFVMKTKNLLELIQTTLDIFFQFMGSAEIQPHYDYYCLCFPKSFVPHFLFIEEQLSILNIHREKGYSQHTEKITEMLLFRNLFLKTLVKSFYVESRKEGDFNVHKMISWLIHFSAKNYILNKLQQGKEQNWQKKLKAEFIPEPQIPENSFLQLNKDDISFKLESFVKILKKEVQKNERKILKKMTDISKKLYVKFENYRRLQYEKVKKETLNKQLLNNSNTYFYKKEEKNLNEKKTKNGKRERKKADRS